MKKRVALITHETSVVGGLPTMVKFLYRTLLESGRYEPTLISLATSASDQASLQLMSPGTWLRGPRIQKKPWLDLMFTHAGVWGSELEFQRYRPRRNLSELLEPYDILQFVVGSSPWARVARDSNRPIMIWTATTTTADRASQRRQASFQRRLWSSLMMPITEQYERQSLQAANTIFALSEYTKRIVEEKVGLDKVLLAPCGIDTNLFHPSPSPAGNYILSVARFSDPRKNLRLLLEAYAELCRRMPDAPDLHLVGEQPSKAVQLRLTELGLAEKVRLIGPKQGEELAEIYRHAKFFVLSSDEEGLAIVILEAMASGLPIVSTDCGGPATAVENGRTGFLTAVGNAAELAGCMEELVADEDLRLRMAKAARKIAEEKFSLAATGQVFLKRYDELLVHAEVSSVNPTKQNGNRPSSASWLDAGDAGQIK